MAEGYSAKVDNTSAQRKKNAEIIRLKDLR